MPRQDSDDESSASASGGETKDSESCKPLRPRFIVKLGVDIAAARNLTLLVVIVLSNLLKMNGCRQGRSNTVKAVALATVCSDS